MQNAVPFNAFDEEFNLNLKIAKVLLENLTGQEKDIAVNWLRRLSNLQTNEISVKKDRNHFLRKLLAVIKQSVFLKVLNHPRYQLLSSREKMLMKDELTKVNERMVTTKIRKFLMEDKEDSSSFMSVWSSDRRTYVAAKPLPGRGALIYMAVSEKPEEGWIIPKKDNESIPE